MIERFYKYFINNVQKFEWVKWISYPSPTQSVMKEVIDDNVIVKWSQHNTLRNKNLSTK